MRVPSALVVTLMLGALPFAQDTSSLLDEHIHTIEFGDGKYAGPGVEWIVERAVASQFVVFGEQHNVTEIPQFVSAIQSRIHDSGFDYLALEMGPIAADAFSTLPFEDVIAQNPFAVAFDNDSDLELVRDSVARFDAPGNAIWGLDQSFSSIHLFEALMAIAPNDEAVAFIKTCLAKVLDERRDYIRNEHFDDVAKLRELFDSAEATRYIDALETSMRIYTNWQKGQSGAPTLYLNLSEREAYMKDRFIAEYNRAVAGGVERPRAIVKLGGAHVMPGIGMNRVLTFGTFAKEFARGMGSEALVIGIWTHNAEPAESPYDSWFAERSGILIDLAALRPYHLAKKLEGFPTTLESSLYAYDAVVIMRGTSRARAKLISPHKSEKTKELRKL